MKAFLLLAVMSSSAWSQAQLPQLVVTQKSYDASPCRLTEAPAELEMIGVFDKEGQRESKSIAGINFVDQPKKLLASFAELTKNFKNKNIEGLKACSTVICAVDAIWGPELGKKLLYLSVVHQANASEYAVPSGWAERFTVAEIDQILKALGDLPPELVHAGKGKFYKAVDQKKGAAAYTVGKNTELYKYWVNAAKNQDAYNSTRTILHEVGHKIDGPKSVIDPSWWKARAADNCGISTYGNSNTREDFAEAFTAYRYDAHALKERCLPKYNYMKKIYKGREYLDEQGCLTKSR